MRKHKPSSKAPDSADMPDASVGGDAAQPLLDDPSSYWQRARYIVLGVDCGEWSLPADAGDADQRCGRVHLALAVLHLVSHHGAVLRLLAGIEPQRRRLHQVPFSAWCRGKGARQDARPRAIAEVRHRHRRSPAERGDFRRELSALSRHAIARRPRRFSRSPV